jgi:hypothetical protein
MTELAKFLVLAGICLIVAGAAVFVLSRVPGLGKLPGDIVIQKGNFSFYFPLATCIIISVILSIILNFWVKK